MCENLTVMRKDMFIRIRCVSSGTNVAWESSRHLATSPQKDVVWETSAEILYWWQFLIHIRVELLKIGSKFWSCSTTNYKKCPDLGSDTSSVWSFCLRHHPAGKAFVASGYVGCFLRPPQWKIKFFNTSLTETKQEPSFLFHKYFPGAHLWPFQSLSLCKFLDLQPIHYGPQDHDEQSKSNQIIVTSVHIIN